MAFTATVASRQHHLSSDLEVSVGRALPNRPHSVTQARAVAPVRKGLPKRQQWPGLARTGSCGSLRLFNGRGECEHAARSECNAAAVCW